MKKSISKILTVALSIIMLMGILPFAVSAAEEGTTYTYVKVGKLTYKVTYKYSEFLGTVIEGNKATAEVSASDEDISWSVTIPSSIKWGGFYGDKYTAKVIGIRSGVFKDRSNITGVGIPDSVKNIGFEAFSGCTGLTGISIPNSVTSIGRYAFSGCTGLKSITIPNSVTSIGGYAFSGCIGLTSITIPYTVTSFGSDVFSGCSGNLLINCHGEDGVVANYIREHGFIEDGIENHTYGDNFEIIKEGNLCTDDSYAEYTCSICQHKKREVITSEFDAEHELDVKIYTEHDFEYEIIPGRYCTDKRCKRTTCKHENCEYVLEEEYPAEYTEHDYINCQTIKEPTLFKTGKEVGYCSRCGFRGTQDIPKLTFTQAVSKWFNDIFGGLKSLFGGK